MSTPLHTFVVGILGPRRQMTGFKCPTHINPSSCAFCGRQLHPPSFEYRRNHRTLLSEDPVQSLFKSGVGERKEQEGEEGRQRQSTNGP